MKILIAAAAAAGALATIPVSSVAQGSGLCPGLRGQARTDCLVAERDRGRRATERVERRNRNLDTARDTTCVVRDFGRHLATGAGYAKGGAAGAAGGNAAYRAGTGAVDRALNNPHPCTPRAR